MRAEGRAPPAAVADDGPGMRPEVAPSGAAAGAVKGRAALREPIHGGRAAAATPATHPRGRGGPTQAAALEAAEAGRVRAA